MTILNALGAPHRAEGVPISGVYYDRAVSVIPGGPMGMRAGAGGVAIGRGGFASADGTVLNSRTAASDAFGIVVSQGGDWRRVFWDTVSRSWRIREGLNLTMLEGAPGMWVKLYSLASWGQQVYVSPIDGRLFAGYADGLEVTRWSVVTPTGPGGLALITTWN